MIKIGGILKFSSLDYPGRLSSVVFCQGCPNRCIYCHNPEFIPTTNVSRETFDDFLTFLDTRKGLLDAVVFSGGEPIMQPNLPECIEIVKNKGFLVGLHTSGVIPHMFKKILHLVDWIGFDIKNSFEHYESITQIPNSGSLAKQSFDMLVTSNTNFEIRTTIDSRIITENNLLSIAKILQDNGIKKWVLQECLLRQRNKSEKLPLPNDDVIRQLSQYVKIEIRKE
ncbi:MAG: anaerobic ribonucleoside-triphosphate reductase activating protein [Alphaproteobacteria bacterium]|nr:anaerobic ribonucleoside-triphosphate reductase activating protein [Alphaproteobacteria bacterium]